jgi:hypothetical protein
MGTLVTVPIAPIAPRIGSPVRFNGDTGDCPQLGEWENVEGCKPEELSLRLMMKNKEQP